MVGVDEHGVVSLGDGLNRAGVDDRGVSLGDGCEPEVDAAEHLPQVLADLGTGLDLLAVGDDDLVVLTQDRAVYFHSLSVPIPDIEF